MSLPSTIHDMLSRRPWAEMEDNSSDDYSGWSSGFTGSSVTGSRNSATSFAQRSPSNARKSTENIESLPPQDVVAVELTTEEYYELLRSVPLDENGKPTSVGSAGHSDRKCKSCPYFNCGIGCKNGIQCPECHIPHVRKNKYRPCKARRDRDKAKKLAAQCAETNASAGPSSGYLEDPTIQAAISSKTSL